MNHRTQLLLLLALALLPACWEGAGTGGGQAPDDWDEPTDDPDTGDDDDTGSDEHAECGDSWGDCQSIGETFAEQSYGCCIGDELAWCSDCEEMEDGDAPWSGDCVYGSAIIRSVDCAAYGFECAYDSELERMACVGQGSWSCDAEPASCQDLGPYEELGCCWDNVSNQCDYLGFYSDDCTALGKTCSFDYLYGWVRCI